MKINTSKRLYFVENKNTVVVSYGILEHQPYKQRITIGYVRKILRSFNLEEKWEFRDVVVFRDQCLEITVNLNSEDNFYDDKEKPKELNLTDYLEQVSLVTVDIHKPLDQQSIQMLKNLMSSFHLNIFHIDSNRYCEDIHKLQRFMERV